MRPVVPASTRSALSGESGLKNGPSNLRFGGIVMIAAFRRRSEVLGPPQTGIAGCEAKSARRQRLL